MEDFKTVQEIKEFLSDNWCYAKKEYYYIPKVSGSVLHSKTWKEELKWKYAILDEYYSDLREAQRRWKNNKERDIFNRKIFPAHVDRKTPQYEGITKRFINTFKDVQDMSFSTFPKYFDFRVQIIPFKFRTKDGALCKIENNPKRFHNSRFHGVSLNIYCTYYKDGKIWREHVTKPQAWARIRSTDAWPMLIGAECEAVVKFIEKKCLGKKTKKSQIQKEATNG